MILKLLSQDIVQTITSAGHARFQQIETRIVYSFEFEMWHIITDNMGHIEKRSSNKLCCGVAWVLAARRGKQLCRSRIFLDPHDKAYICRPLT